MRARSNLRNK